MPRYVDGFVIPIPTRNLPAYRRIATLAGKVWKERHELSAFVFQDKIWIAGGHAQPLSNEVWSLFVPEQGLASD